MLFDDTTHRLQSFTSLRFIPRVLQFGDICHIVWYISCVSVPQSAGGVETSYGRPRDPTRHQRLLEAVADELVSSGFLNSSLRSLAGRVGVAPNTLEYHFGSRAGLFCKALAFLRTRETLRLRELIASDSQNGLLDLIDIGWGALSAPEARPAGLALLEIWVIALRHPDDYREFLDHVVAEWIAIATGYGSSDSIPLNPRLEGVITLALASLRGLLLDLLTSDEETRPRIEAALGELRTVVASASEVLN